MTVSRLSSYRDGLIPGFAVAFVSIAVAWVLGGPIAAALVGFFAVGALLIDMLLCLWLLHERLRRSRVTSIVVGAAFYVASVIVVLIIVNFWGPSQIM